MGLLDQTMAGAGLVLPPRDDQPFKHYIQYSTVGLIAAFLIRVSYDRQGALLRS